MTNQKDKIIVTLEQKLQFCDDFLTVSLRLKKALEIDEAQAIEDLINRREQLIATIDGLDRRMTLHVRAGSVDRCPAIVRQVDKITGELKERLKQIVFVNHQCETVASGRREGLKNEMISIKREGEGLHGYVRGTQRMSKFLNIRT